PSTHDMSTIREWWEEDKYLTQHFYNMQLGQQGEAPAHCEPWISRAIILQHLHSPAMLSIFQLQDLLGMTESLRRPDAGEERINVPANPKHYWKYRMHFPIEQLMKEKLFNAELKDFIKASGRN
ncbi:MAG: 4-alpha-glucanotransferase, partial [Chitinophagaceae bacterium]|nr:4-alpha-glucanotransferase [Chitinophagaceae bacterium]